MNLFKMSFMTAAAVFLLVGCNGVDGTFNAAAPLALKIKGETIMLAPGQYKAEVSRNRKGTALKFEVRDGKKNRKVKFELNNSRLPQGNGEFVMNGADTGQAFDVHGKVATDVVTGELIRGTESCMYQVYNPYCGDYYRYPRGGYPYPRGGYPYPQDGYYYGHCQYTIQGWQQVEFRNVMTTTGVSLEFADSQTDQTIGNFDGTRTDTVRNYEYISGCR